MIEKIQKNEKYIKILFVITMFILCFIWSCSQPYGQTPDEGMKMDICRYIIENHKLPHGGDESIRDAVWGISYGFTPIFSYMISALFMRIVMFFTTDFFAMVVAARFVSVLCYTGTIIFTIKIAKKLFSGLYQWLFIILIACLPQFVFLGTYINNDSLALFSTAIIIYSWIIGLQNKWDWKSCITMAIGIGLCALSYYNAYGFILASVIIYVVSYIIEQGKNMDVKEFFKKGIVIFFIAFAIAGWWFIRSAIIYEGDFLGLKITNEYAEQYAIEQYKPSVINTPAKHHSSLIYMIIKWEWAKSTFQSFVGMFGNMCIALHPAYYYITMLFFGITGIGSIVYLWKMVKNKCKEKTKENKKQILLMVVFLLCIIIPILLSLYYSYYSDFQPQGRYIMPMLIPFMYFITKGLQTLFELIEKKWNINSKIRKIIILLIGVTWYIVPILSLTMAVIPFYKIK